jgi:hypothetical protein
MSEVRKTAIALVAAAGLAALAWWTAPGAAAPSTFEERGAPFFPQFTDPNAAASLEVVEFDEQTSLARPFKVLNRDGRWTIPSRHNYPADGQQRLAQAAAAIIALKKDDIASDNAADHEACGVLDPLDETLPTSLGRGTRLTVKGPNETVLADIIVGKPVEGRPRLRYVRIPSQKRVFVANVGDFAVSTNFNDWIERNLLQVDRYDIDSVGIRNYSLDKGTGRIDVREIIRLDAIGRDEWRLDGMAPSEQIHTFNMNLLITKLVDLSIVDVYPKPPGLTATLSRATRGTRLLRTDVEDLAAKGFYFTPEGQMLATNGEVLVHTTSGIFFTLRFGEVVQGDNRYLFIAAGLDRSTAGNQAAVKAAEQRLEVLSARFAPWYYVIPADSFNKIRLDRRALVQPRGSPAPTP